MFCGKCNNDLSECTCLDVDERMATLKNSPYLAFKWCRKCDKHYARCRCEEPQFYITGVKEPPQKLN